MALSSRWTGAGALAVVLSAAACGDVHTEARRTETAASPSPAASASPSPDRAAFVAAVDEAAADALQRGPLAGLSIAVFDHGPPVLAKAYGFADIEARQPAGPETSYPIASVSK